MVQRNGTCVVTPKAAELVGAPDYAEDSGIPRYALNDFDLFLNSIALPQLLQIAAQPEVGITAKYKAIDKELLEGLEKAGYKLQYSIEPGGPEVGTVGFLYERAAAKTRMSKLSTFRSCYGVDRLHGSNRCWVCSAYHRRQN